MFLYDIGLCKGLKNSGVDVAWFTCEKTPNHEGIDIRRTYFHVYGDRAIWKRALRYVIGALSSIFQSVIEGRIICHFHVFHTGILELVSVLVARSVRRKIVITVHDVEPLYESRQSLFLNHMLYSMAHRIIAHNEVVQKELIRLYNMPLEKISIIPHGNYIHSLGLPLEKDKARELIGIPKDSKAILFFGLIKEIKGLDLLINAMPYVIEAHPKVVCIVAGRPWKTSFVKYSSLIEQLNLENHFMLNVRFIQEREINHFYYASDMVVLPYRKIYQSGVVLLAMSYARPVLASNIPGMAGMITDGKNGYLFKTDDVTSLAQKLISCMANSEELFEVGQEGYNFVKKNFDWDHIGWQTSSLYRDLVVS